MPDFKFMPLQGIDNRNEDAELHDPPAPGASPALRVRDARNWLITADGRLRMRPGWRRVTDAPYRDLWQDRVSGALFARLGTDWVRITDLAAGTHQVLGAAGEGPCAHLRIGDRVLLSSAAGCLSWDGQQARALGIPRPAGPALAAFEDGNLPPGRYGACCAWVRGDGAEGGTSLPAFIDLPPGRRLAVTAPLDAPPDMTHCALYLTSPDGGQFTHEADLLPGQQAVIALPALAGRSEEPPFPLCEPMPGGQYAAHWQGRLVTATGRVLRFSEPLACHVHDSVTGSVPLPQRITFVVALPGGLWVGQRDHALWLAGPLEEMKIERHATGSPVPGSATLAEPGELRGEIGKDACALWLGEYGYVAGTDDGQAQQLQQATLAGITGGRGSTVVTSQRAYTAVDTAVN